jgi:hypothetical protein
MKVVYFNPNVDSWTCIHNGDMKKREVLLCILESKGMKIFVGTREHWSVNTHPNIHHRSIEEKNHIVSEIDIVGRSSVGGVGVFGVTYDFIIYYYSTKYLF